MPAVLIKKESDIDEALDRLLLDDFSVYGDDASLFAKTQKKYQTIHILFWPQ